MGHGKLLILGHRNLILLIIVHQIIMILFFPIMAVGFHPNTTAENNKLPVRGSCKINLIPPVNCGFPMSIQLRQQLMVSPSHSDMARMVKMSVALCVLKILMAS